MPIVTIKIKKDGMIDMDYIGFSNSFCDKAENSILARLKSLKMKTEMEDRKDEDLLQEETQHD